MKIPSIRTWALRSTLLSAIWLSLCLCVFAKPDPTGRTVKYSQQDIIQVRAKVRFSTLIVLPQDEEILDFATGDNHHLPSDL